MVCLVDFLPYVRNRWAIGFRCYARLVFFSEDRSLPSLQPHNFDDLGLSIFPVRDDYRMNGREDQRSDYEKSSAGVKLS